MSADEKPLGQRFSHVYVERGEPAQDSPRMRRRLASAIDASEVLKSHLSKKAEQDLGIPTPWSTNQSWISHLEKWKLQDVLDLVTIAFQCLVECRRKNLYHTTDYSTQWVIDVTRIFLEENVHYIVDARGGVHFHFDEEFSRNNASTIASLQNARYANALHSFDAGIAALAKAPPDGKNAIRGIFNALEGLFRLMFPNAPRLVAGECEKLRPLIQTLYAGDKPALGASEKSLKSFMDWIEAAHFYRHESGKADEVAQPPLTLAVYLCSAGASHLRWLAELDSVSKIGQ